MFFEPIWHLHEVFLFWPLKLIFENHIHNINEFLQNQMNNWVVNTEHFITMKIIYINEQVYIENTQHKFPHVQQIYTFCPFASSASISWLNETQNPHLLWSIQSTLNCHIEIIRKCEYQVVDLAFTQSPRSLFNKNLQN